MKETRFTCDVCGNQCRTDKDEHHRPNSAGWLTISIVPYWSENPHKIPYVQKDVCSTSCAIQLMTASASRLEEMRNAGTVSG